MEGGPPMPRLFSRQMSVTRPVSQPGGAAGWISIGALVALANVGFAQAVDPKLFITNGTVNAVVRSGGTLYVGGQFTRVGPATGSGVPLAPSGAAASAFPKVAGGFVNAVAADGSGGGDIGGGVVAVGGG